MFHKKDSKKYFENRDICKMMLLKLANQGFLSGPQQAFIFSNTCTFFKHFDINIRLFISPCLKDKPACVCTAFIKILPRVWEVNFSAVLSVTVQDHSVSNVHFSLF